MSKLIYNLLLGTITGTLTGVGAYVLFRNFHSFITSVAYASALVAIIGMWLSFLMITNPEVEN